MRPRCVATGPSWTSSPVGKVRIDGVFDDRAAEHDAVGQGVAEQAAAPHGARIVGEGHRAGAASSASSASSAPSRPRVTQPIGCTRNDCRGLGARAERGDSAPQSRRGFVSPMQQTVVKPPAARGTTARGQRLAVLVAGLA